jgi:hypothetical protein
MAGIRGRSGRPGNQNAFRHGLAGILQRRADGVLNPAEQSVREEICPAYCLISGQLRRSVYRSRYISLLVVQSRDRRDTERGAVSVWQLSKSSFLVNLGPKMLPDPFRNPNSVLVRRKIKSLTEASYGRARRRRIRT